MKTSTLRIISVVLACTAIILSAIVIISGCSQHPTSSGLRVEDVDFNRSTKIYPEAILIYQDGTIIHIGGNGEGSLGRKMKMNRPSVYREQPVQYPGLVSMVRN